MLKILTKRERIILSVTIGVIIFAGGFNLLIAPLLNKNEHLNQEIYLARAKLRKYLRLLQQKDYLRDKYSQYFSSVGISSEGQDGLVNTLSELEKLAQDAGIKIIDLRPQTQELLDLRAQGAMEGYLKFIYALENSTLLLKVKRFQVTAKPASGTLEAYFSILVQKNP